MRLFWGADIEVFYKEIQQSWDVLSKRIQEGTFLGPKKTEVTSYTEKYLLFKITFVLKNKDYHLYYTYNVYVYCFRVYDSFSNLYEFLWQVLIFYFSWNLIPFVSTLCQYKRILIAWSSTLKIYLHFIRNARLKSIKSFEWYLSITARPNHFWCRNIRTTFFHVNIAQLHQFTHL